jgi:hypothetical protein
MNVHYEGGGVDGKSISEDIAPLPKGERSPTKKSINAWQKRDDATLHNKKAYVRNQKTRLQNPSLIIISIIDFKGCRLATEES